MKLLIITLLAVFLLDYGVSPAKLQRKENETELGQQRSARVQRVSNFEDTNHDESHIEKFLRDVISKQAAMLTSQNFVEFLKHFPNIYALVQQEAKLFLELNVILDELIQDGTASLQNMELVISEMTDADKLSTTIEPTPRDVDDSRNVSSSLQNLDVQLQNSEENDDGSDSRPAHSGLESINESELIAVKNIARSLDNVMKKIQDHISFVRRVFDKLCRRRHRTFTRPSASNPERFALMNQPNEVPTLQT